MGRWLRAYHDRELSPGRTRLVEEHVGRCEDCRVALGEIRRISRTLRAALTPPVVPSTGLAGGRDRRGGIASGTLALILGRSRKERAEEAALIRSLQRVAALAAVFLIAAVLGWVWWTPRTGSSGESQVYAQEYALEIVLSDPSWKEEF